MIRHALPSCTVTATSGSVHGATTRSCFIAPPRFPLVLADGLAIDRNDRVYITTVTGVQVFDAKGQYLGTITAGRQAANVAFAGPGKSTLYLTAREGLYRVKTLAQGPDRLGK
jgi:sugar lactone lactonase YvrE